MPDVYLDEDMSLKLVPLLTGSGISVRTARDEQRKSALDDEQLLHAVHQRWVFLTHNRGDYELLHDAWRRWGCTPVHVGILTMDHAPVDELAQALTLFFQTHGSIENELWDWSRAHGWSAAPRDLYWAVPPT